MTSALSSVSGFDFQRATVLAGIQKQFNQRVAEQSAVINSNYAARIGTVQRDSSKWEAFREDLDDSRGVVSGALSRLKSIQSMLDQLILTVNKARLDLSLAHDVSGLGSTRVVRLSASGRRRHHEPNGVATGSQGGEVL